VAAHEQADVVRLESLLMEAAAWARGCLVERLDDATLIVEHGEEPLPFYGMRGPSGSVGTKHLCDDKRETRRLLKRAGLATPTSRAFARRRRREAWEFAAERGGRVVVKPHALVGGSGVTLGVRDEEAFERAWDEALTWRRRRHAPRVIVEEQCEGEDFRVFVVGDRVVSVTQRRRASVHGDGQRTVSELIAHKNQARAANPGLRNYPIPTDPALLDQLATSGYHLHDIPPAGHHLTLRSVSNLSAGGDSIDVTDQTHPAVNALAVRAVRAIPGLAYAGVDLITPSVTQPPDDVGYVISEIEFSPGPMSHFPAEGTPRDMAGAVLDHYLTTPTTR